MSCTRTPTLTLEEGGEISLICGSVRVDWVNLDEGISGEYDPTDPEDVNLLRFDVYACTGPNGGWEEVECGSSCTFVRADTPLDRLAPLAATILAAVSVPLRRGESVKAICERLSWIDAAAAR